MFNYLTRLARAAGATIIGFSVMAGSATAQQALTPKDIQDRGTVKVGVLVDFPPFGITNESNQPDGYDADVAKALAKKMGVKIELVPVTGPNRIPYLQTGKIDMVIGSLSITPARSEQVLFSAPYCALEGVMYARKDLKITDYSDLGGSRIGVARASPQDTLVTKHAPAGTKIQRFDQISAVYQSVLSQQVDGAVIGTLIAAELDKKMEGRYETKFRLYVTYQGVALRLGSDELAAALNADIAELNAEGVLSRLYQKWIGSALPDLAAAK